MISGFPPQHKASGLSALFDPLSLNVLRIFKEADITLRLKQIIVKEIGP
jgi:hypothetical protein